MLTSIFIVILSLGGRMFAMERISRSCHHTLGLLTQHLEKNDRLLDIGCGNGELAYFLERNGFNSVHNVDILDLREFETSRFDFYNGINLPFEDRQFSWVSLNFVLHHLPNEKKGLLLAESIRVTNGRLFILEDTPRNVVDRFFSYNHGVYHRSRINSAEDFGFLRQSQWEELFREIGLKIVVSQKLGRFCRNISLPFARSLFILEQ